MTDRLGYAAAPPVVVLPTGNVWGFGQVIAIIFLLLPFISFFEVVYGGHPLAEDNLAIVRRCRY